MFYIHQSTAISPQASFGQPHLGQLHESVHNRLRVIEPAYSGIPPGLLRRMGKAVRIGVGSALSIMKDDQPVGGIIIGTGNGGMEDCIKFLNQIIEYEEGMLAPGNFVQSTANAMASQLGLMKGNKCYNMTHVHRGLAFENAMLDAEMLVAENPGIPVLLGAVDEISAYNYHIDYLDGWYKTMPVSNKQLYELNSPASLAGEGATMFIVNDMAAGASARVQAMATLHSPDPAAVSRKMNEFLEENECKPDEIDLLISGENGDNRLNGFYRACEAAIGIGTGISRFKHMCGEYPTASAMGLWLACQILQTQSQPLHMVKKPASGSTLHRILIYNNFKALQHSLILVIAG